LEQAIPLLEAARDSEGLPFALNHLGYAADLQGAFDQAWRYFDRALAVAEQVRDSTLVAFMLSNRGDIAFSAGRWDEAGADFTRALDVIREVQVSWVTAYPFAEAGMLALAQGRREAAHALFDHATSLADRPGHRRLVEILRWVAGAQAEGDLLEGQAIEALTRLEPLLDQNSREELPIIHLLALCGWARLQLGDVAAAEELLAVATTRASAGGLRPALANALRVQALVRVAQRRWGEAYGALEEALALCRAMPAPWAEAKAHYVYAQAQVAQGEGGQARKAYEQALSICMRLGEGLYRPYIQQALAELDHTPPSG
jgi:tetratricopeptide (TPR) repeat protein